MSTPDAAPPQLGDRVREIVTGWEGTVTGYCEYLWGCEQLLVYVDGETNKDGNPRVEWYDINRLMVIDRAVISPMAYDKAALITRTPVPALSGGFSGPDKPAPVR